MKVIKLNNFKCSGTFLNAYKIRLLYNRKNIRSLIFIKIFLALAEIKSQNKAANINNKGGTGKPKISSSCLFEKYGIKQQDNRL